MAGMGIHDAARLRGLHRKTQRIALLSAAGALLVVALGAWLLLVAASR
jgi:hypothetical protein